MPTDVMVNAWLDHCTQVGHKTQADALANGEKIGGRKDLATYSSGLTRIWCNAKGCVWQFEDTKGGRQ